MSSTHALAASAPATPLPSPLPQYSAFASEPASPPLRRRPPAPPPTPTRTEPPAAGPLPKVRQGFVRDHTIFGPLLKKRVAPGTGAGYGTPGPQGAAPSTPRITGVEAKAIKFFDKWTSKMGLAKIGAFVGLAGLAGVGGYFSVKALMAALAAGVSTKLSIILLAVGVGIAVALLAIVVGRLVYKAWKNMRADLAAKREACV